MFKVVKAYQRGMKLDDNEKVRKKCTELIGLNKVTLLDIIDRLDTELLIFIFTFI